MFTLINTWMGYHEGKPRVLREAVLAVLLGLLFRCPEGKRDAARTRTQDKLKQARPQKLSCLLSFSHFKDT